jgi:hypothetical protein
LFMLSEANEVEGRQQVIVIEAKTWWVHKWSDSFLNMFQKKSHHSIEEMSFLKPVPVSWWLNRYHHKSISLLPFPIHNNPESVPVKSFSLSESSSRRLKV